MRLGAGVQHSRTIDKHRVVVIPGAWWRAGVGPRAVVAFDHVIRKRIERILPGGDQRDLHLLRIGSCKAEGDPVIAFNPRILRSKIRCNGEGRAGWFVWAMAERPANSARLRIAVFIVVLFSTE